VYYDGIIDVGFTLGIIGPFGPEEYGQLDEL
jgi:hypothetical protein